eukprot:TRINITY_DN13397_c0_g1_i3.p1 TRINITY_DN13397_c0_g1~~TRINITY_DN13397_c0_g1_i3.p1  ORF type:complete len:429 (-),score=70.85 TRINITY_DN13397_c0_g1_i3:240-1469(-)
MLVSINCKTPVPPSGKVASVPLRFYPSKRISTLRNPQICAIVDNPLFQTASVGEDLISLAQNNPILLVAGIGAVAVPLLLLNRGGSKGVKSVSPAASYEALAEDSSVLLIDIRPRSVINQEGSPDIRATGKKLIQIPYTKINKEGEEVQVEQFVSLVGKRVSEDQIVTLIDQFGSLSKSAAQALFAEEAVEGTVYYVEGGCNGFKGWREQLPWRDPLKLDIGQILNPKAVAASAGRLTEQYQKNPTLVNGALAVAGVAGATALLFTEVETLLEVVGVVGVLQFLARKLLFAEDRKRTLAQLRELIDNKIAAGEAGKDLRRLADALLESEAGQEKQASVNGVQQSQPSIPDNQNVIEATKWVEAWRAKQNKSQTQPIVTEEPVRAEEQVRVEEPVRAAAELQYMQATDQI